MRLGGVFDEFVVFIVVCNCLGVVLRWMCKKWWVVSLEFWFLRGLIRLFELMVEVGNLVVWCELNLFWWGWDFWGGLGCEIFKWDYVDGNICGDVGIVNVILGIFERIVGLRKKMFVLIEKLENIIWVVLWLLNWEVVRLCNDFIVVVWFIFCYKVSIVWCIFEYRVVGFISFLVLRFWRNLVIFEWDINYVFGFGDSMCK